MASIKSLMKAAMLKIGASAASPSATSVGITVTTGGSTTYVAPNDGFVSMACDGATGNRILLSSERVETSMISYAGNFLYSTTLPVRKGASVLITYTGEGKVYFCQFVKSIGGGLKVLYKQCSSFLERGALWPRLSLCSTPQSRLGADSPTPTLRGKSISRRYTTAGAVGTHHRTTGGSWSVVGGLENSILTKSMERVFARGCYRVATRLNQFRSKRDIQSRFISPVGTQKWNFVSSPQAAGSDFSFCGGVA